MPPRDDHTLTREVIRLGEPTLGEPELAAVRAVFESGWVAGQGPLGSQVEQALVDITGNRHAVLVSNCTAALHLALLALGVGPGDEVLVADYTYPATGHAVMFTGAQPRFVDVRADTGTIDVDAARDAIGPKTQGIIAVDVFGQSADVQPLRELADSLGLFLLEDAAAAMGARYRGNPIGAFADVTCVSFHGRKGITCGEGGAVLTNSTAVADQVRKLSCFGIASAYQRQSTEQLAVPEFDELGFNYKLSDVAAAILGVQLDRLAGLIRTREQLATAYGELLADEDALVLPVELADRWHVWQTYAVTLDDRVDRGRVAATLRGQGIQATIGTFASHLQPVYGRTQSCPTSRRLFDQHLALPMHANLDEDDVQVVAEALRHAVAANAGH